MYYESFMEKIIKEAAVKGITAKKGLLFYNGDMLSVGDAASVAREYDVSVEDLIHILESVHGQPL